MRHGRARTGDGHDGEIYVIGGGGVANRASFIRDATKQKRRESSTIKTMGKTSSLLRNVMQSVCKVSAASSSAPTYPAR